MSNQVEILIIAKDEASGVADKVAKAIGGIGAGAGGINIASTAMTGLKVAAGGAMAIIGGVGAILAASVKEASESQAALAQLDSVLKSTGADQRAIGIATQEASYHTVVSNGHTVASGKELGKLSSQLEKAKAHLAQLNASWSDHKTHTNSATLAMQNAQAKVAALTAQIAAGGQVVGKGIFKVADIVPPLQMSREALINMATSLSRVTKYSDETVIGAESMLLTFTNIGGKAMPMATEAVLDLSTAMGTDTKASAVMLGKALNDPIKGVAALTRVGVTFSDEQKNLIKHLQKSGDMLGAQKVILAEVNKEFGGSAKAAGQTFAGQLEIAKNAIGELEEAIGTRLLPILTPLIGKFTDFAMQAMPLVEDAVGAVGDVIEGVIEFITGASNGLGSLKDAGERLAKVFGGSAAEWQKAVEWMAQAAKDMVTAVKNAWEGLKTLGTWTTTVLVPWLKKAWDTIKADAKAFGDWLKPYEDWLWNAAIDAIVWFNNKAVPWLKKAWEDIKATAKVFGDWLAPYMKTVWDAAIDAIVWFNNKAVPWLKKAWEDIKATAKMIFWDWIVPYIATQLAGALLAFTWFKENVVPLLVKAWDTMKSDAKRLWFDWIAPAADTAVSGVDKAFHFIAEKLAPWLSDRWEEMKATAKRVWFDWIAPAADTAVSGVDKAFHFIAEKLAPWLSDRWEELKATAKRVWFDWIAPAADTAFTAMDKAVHFVIEELVPWLSARWDDMKKAADLAWQWIHDKIKEWLGKAYDVVSGALSDLKTAWDKHHDEIKKALDKALAALEKAFSNSWAAIQLAFIIVSSDLVKAGGALGSDLVAAVAKKISDAADKIKDAITAAVQTAIDAAKSLVDHFLGWVAGLRISLPSISMPSLPGTGSGGGGGGGSSGGGGGGFGGDEGTGPHGQAFRAASMARPNTVAGGGQTVIINVDARGSTTSATQIKQAIKQALDEMGMRGDARIRMN